MENEYSTPELYFRQSGPRAPGEHFSLVKRPVYKSPGAILRRSNFAMRDMIQWVFLVAYVFFVAALLTFPFRRKNTPFWKDFVIAVPIAAIGLVSMVALRSFIDNATDWVFRLHGGNLILGTVAIGLGVTIFVFKKKSQLWYGVLELIFGAFSASAVASGM